MEMRLTFTSEYISGAFRIPPWNENASDPEYFLIRLDASLVWPRLVGGSPVYTILTKIILT